MRRSILILLLLGPAAAAAQSSRYQPLIWDGCPNSGYTTEAQAPRESVRINLIAPYSVRKMMKEGEPVDLVDVRSHWHFLRTHLAGARNLPYETIEAAVLPEKRLQVLYCEECCCPEIVAAAEGMLNRGRRDMVVLRAGLEEIGDLVLWKARNVELEEEPDNFNQLPCGPARAAIKALTKQMKLAEIPPIEFELDSAVLMSYSLNTLETVADIMYDHPSIELSVHGHSCDIGSEGYNLKLSQRRSKAVAEYLVKAGVRKGAVSSRGYGKSEPIASNDTAEGRALNRRVEFHWVQRQASRKQNTQGDLGVKTPMEIPE